MDARILGAVLGELAYEVPRSCAYGGFESCCGSNTCCPAASKRPRAPPLLHAPPLKHRSHDICWDIVPADLDGSKDDQTQIRGFRKNATAKLGRHAHIRGRHDRGMVRDVGHRTSRRTPVTGLRSCKGRLPPKVRQSKYLEA